MIPIVVVLICIGWRILLRRKAEEKEDEAYLGIKSRPIDPDESEKINSDDESIPYKKDSADDSPEPTEGVKVVDNAENYPYDQQYGAQTQPSQRQWAGETEIN